MKVAAYVDEMGTSMSEPAQEYFEIRQFVAHAVGHGCEFDENIRLHMLSNRRCDVYVIDFGGMSGPGRASGQILAQELIRQIESRPNTLFVIWSAITFREYRAEMMDHLSIDDPDEVPLPPNLAIKTIDDAVYDVGSNGIGELADEDTDLVKKLRFWDSTVNGKANAS